MYRQYMEPCHANCMILDIDVLYETSCFRMVTRDGAYDLKGIAIQFQFKHRAYDIDLNPHCCRIHIVLDIKIRAQHKQDIQQILKI